jgi:hypothetical protein
MQVFIENPEDESIKPNYSDNSDYPDLDSIDEELIRENSQVRLDSKFQLFIAIIDYLESFKSMYIKISKSFFLFKKNYIYCQ